MQFDIQVLRFGCEVLTVIEQHSQTPADELLDQWPRLRNAERLEAFHRFPQKYMDNFFLELDARAQAKLVLALPRLHFLESARRFGGRSFGKTVAETVAGAGLYRLATLPCTGGDCANSGGSPEWT